jgi:osmotically-inducible protein OsmY
VPERRDRMRLRMWLVCSVASLAGGLGALSLMAAPGSEDMALSGAVHRRFETAQGIPAPFIKAGATNGVVTLTGAVDNLLAKDRAAQIAATVPGVTNVRNELVVLPADRSPWELRDGVAAALAGAPALSADKIFPRVQDGFVTLEGTVGSWPERRLAGFLAEGVDGVRGVDNKLVVAYGAARSNGEIQADVQSQLKWDPWLDAPERLEVRVGDGQVRIAGLVDSDTARRHVYQDGWVSGVKWVDVSGVQVVPNVPVASSASGILSSERPTVAGSLTDEQLQKEVAGACQLDPVLKPAQVQVQVHQGVVILQGLVPSATAKEIAGEIAREVAGPGQVENLLKVSGTQGS